MAAEHKPAPETSIGELASAGSEAEAIVDVGSSHPGGSEPSGGDEGGAGTTAHLGTTKYVQGAFFASGILLTYLLGKILAALWNRLAEWPPAVRALPQLLRYAEDERPSITLPVGAVIALAVIIQTYRKEGIRSWADDVATELSKVVWPTKETVTNGTIVVIVASLVATVYVGLLDRLWSFVTTLVYGA